MRDRYTRILKAQFWDRAIRSQEAMARHLLMATRTYADIERGKACCGALTLTLYLIYLCPDPMRFLSDLRSAMERERDAA